MDRKTGSVHATTAVRLPVEGQKRRRRTLLGNVGVFWLVALLAAWLGTGMGRAYAADGDLDTTFAGTGATTTDFGENDLGHDVAIQADGKIVVAGGTGFTGADRFALARYNTDGSLDTSFDGDGKLTTDGFSEALQVAVQADGKIVAAGISFNVYQDFGLARYNPDGSLDTNFAGDGTVWTDIAGDSDYLNAMVIQPDGKIVVGGSTRDDDEQRFRFALVRYNVDGSLDTSFDGDGKVVTTIVTGQNSDEITGLAIQGDGKIVAAGWTEPTDPSQGVYRFALARYASDGSLDTSFDGDGIAITGFGGEDLALAVALQSDGKIVVGGQHGQPTGYDFALARYNADGSLDSGFDGDGFVTTDISEDGIETVQDLLIQPDGKIVAAGEGYGDYAIVRYNTNGSPDSTFSGDGIISTNISGGDHARGIAQQPDGKLVAAGYSASNFSVARYLSSGGGPVPPGQKFSDVPPGSTYYDYINCLVDQGVISGYSDQTFRPQSDITRGQLSKVIANAAGYNEAVSGQRFSDVPPGSTFYEFVERMASRGVISGYGDGTFRPGNNATRGQISKIVSNAMGFNEPVSGQCFSDVPPGSTYYEFIERMASRSIIGGYGDGTFKPNNNASRGQVSKIVANAFFPDCSKQAATK